MKITREQALYGAKSFSDYFDRFESIADYMRDQKLNAVDEMSFGLHVTNEMDLFDNFDMHPEDMNIEVVEMNQNMWDIYIKIISSHSNMTSI